jgi:Kdo2-lipid IVA lauroyltransferase/acyltransferase
MLGSDPSGTMLERMAVMNSRFLGPRYWPTWVGLGVLRLVERLPFAALLAVGRWIGRLARHAPLPYAAVARRNIALCLPELGVAEREALINQHFESLGIGMLESAMTWWSRDERINALSTVAGLEHLEAALARGRGAIILTAHFTTLQIGARILNNRIPINVLYRPLKNELLAAVSGGSFGRQARQAIKQDDVRAMIGALRRNEIVWYASDQSYERLPGTQGWRATVYPPFADWPGPDPVADTLRYHACIEAQVRKMPDQYWWIHRRFKGLTPDYPDYYGPAQRITRQQNG